MSNSVVNIDSTWLTGNTNKVAANGPYNLRAAHTTYNLTVDVYATGTFNGSPVFAFTAPDTYLELNGHFIYANQIPYHDVQPLSSQNFSMFNRKCIPGNAIVNHGGRLFQPNDTTVPINVDPASLGEYQEINTELL